MFNRTSNKGDYNQVGQRRSNLSYTSKGESGDMSDSNTNIGIGICWVIWDLGLYNQRVDFYLLPNKMDRHHE